MYKIGGHYEFNGTYAHPKLVPHICSWISLKLAIIVSDIVNECEIKKFKDENLNLRK